jgi:MFS family permease
MDLRNRIGLYGSYFLATSGIGFTLPYLAVYLGAQGLSGRAIGLISALAALTSLAQFPIGLWSDRLGARKPFLIAMLATVALATWLLTTGPRGAWLGLLIVVFAENGICRAVVESLAGAEAAALARPGEVGAALGALRFWKPIGIILVALLGGWMAGRFGVGSILGPLAIIQTLAVAAALLIHEGGDSARSQRGESAQDQAAGQTASMILEKKSGRRAWLPRDRGLWSFVGAMVLFHMANAPAGIYLGPYLKQLRAPDAALSHAFVVSMVAWMLVVWPAGRLADRLGRKPLLVAGWASMALRLAIVAEADSFRLVEINQALDGLANGLFAVVEAAWVTDRLADPRRAGEAQVIVGTALVFGSALGPALAGLLIGPLGYRRLFGLLAGLGLVATSWVILFVPETAQPRPTAEPEWGPEPLATVSDLSTTP